MALISDLCVACAWRSPKGGERRQRAGPDALGFMCGIEVHQQLATGKLHSRQPGVLYDVTEETVPDTWPRTRRRLRAARGEGGAVDVAARFEAKRRRSFEYVQSPNAGLIELDERPPLPLDSDAVDVTLTVAALLEARPVDLMQTMRKPWWTARTPAASSGPRWSLKTGPCKRRKARLALTSSASKRTARGN